MFAGIIERVCRVAAVRPGGTTAPGWLEIDLGELSSDVRHGSSLAINGVCLTMTALRGSTGQFDVVPETWALTNLRHLQAGGRVNVERALRAGDRIDGHFVQGHVDGLGTIDQIARDGGEYRIWLRVAPELMRYIVRKGSVALDGVSLTIADVGTGRFSVALIPTTLADTVWHLRAVGDDVNVETDILARLVVSRLEAITGGAVTTPGETLTWQRLLESGFLT